MNRIPLEDAAYLRKANDRTPLTYILWFSDGTAYVGSAVGIYRIRRYLGIARKTSLSITKNPLLISALITYDCLVSVFFKETITEARKNEILLYSDLELRGIELRNCREGGVAGKWVRQSPETHARRIAALTENGCNSSLCNAPKMSNGKSRYAMKGVLSRTINKGQELRRMLELPQNELDELRRELEEER